jgi:hypothetical protein
MKIETCQLLEAGPGYRIVPWNPRCPLIPREASLCSPDSIPARLERKDEKSHLLLDTPTERRSGEGFRFRYCQPFHQFVMV